MGWRSDGLVSCQCLVATDSLAVDLCENSIIGILNILVFAQ